MAQSKLLMLKGLPASGKSTYAKELVAKGWKRVNKDDLRAMIDNGKWSKGNESSIVASRDLLISHYLGRGCDVVVDDTNLVVRHESDLRAIAEANQADFEVKFFDITPDEAIKRDLARERSVGSKVIRRMYRDHLAPERITQSNNLPLALIVDIDGTLAHMTGRSPYDYSKVLTDEIDDVVEALVLTYSTTHEIIVVSGRDGSCREDTEQWLKHNGVPYGQLFMREAGDDRNDAIVKREIFDREIRDKYFIDFVLDDRDRVVEMWRSLGLKCLQVAEGDF